MKIIQTILSKNDCYRSGRKMDKVEGLMLHSVGCPQPRASVFTNNWNRPNHKVCVHAFIDGLTGEIRQTLPWNHRAWHCGASANNNYIGVEMCEPDCIRYTHGATFTCSNPSRAKEICLTTYNSAVELFAFLCKEYDLNPLGKNVIVSHDEGHQLGIASNHVDPTHLWGQLGTGLTMDKFRKDVNDALVKLSGGEINTPDPVNDGLYRIQMGAFEKSSNAENLLNKVHGMGYTNAFMKKIGNYYKIQLGAFSVRENADAMAKELQSKGLDVFIAFTEKNDSNDVPSEPKKSVDDVAREVINGMYGNGSEREERLYRLGYDPDEVQAKVNEILSGKKPVPEKTVDEVAHEVIAGKYGNGSAREDNIKKLGYDPDEVQNRVNEILNSGAKHPTKTLDEVAREVIAGKYGNGSAREDKLKEMGYDPKEVQRRVNQLLK